MAKRKESQDDDEGYVRRAFAAYYRGPGGELRPHPANDSGFETFKGKEYIVLRNVNGVLAVYRIRNDGTLKRLKRWPEEVE